MLSQVFVDEEAKEYDGSKNRRKAEQDENPGGTLLSAPKLGNVAGRSMAVSEP